MFRWIANAFRSLEGDVERKNWLTFASHFEAKKKYSNRSEMIKFGLRLYLFMTAAYILKHSAESLSVAIDEVLGIFTVIRHNRIAMKSGTIQMYSFEHGLFLMMSR